MTRLTKVLLVMMAAVPAAAFGMAKHPCHRMRGSLDSVVGGRQQGRRNNLRKGSIKPLSLSYLNAVPRGGASTMPIVDLIKNWNSSPKNLFNSSLLTLAVITAVIKVIQRAAASSLSDSNSSAPAKPASVKALQIRFLAVFWLLRCADWLQGPYFYEVYASKVFGGVPASISLISQLFLTGFASTALFGPLVGRAVDAYGRKRGTLAFSLIYALGAASTKSPLRARRPTTAHHAAFASAISRRRPAS